jgi:drug/metabolite transporter (DMT)-like permease
MIAFAGNSLLCRLALSTTRIDPASFTTIRMLSGAFALFIIVSFRNRFASAPVAGNWLSAAALFGYAICFSFAYISLPAGTGALLLFGAVQITMIAYGLFLGERLTLKQLTGIALAVAGLVGLLFPGMQAPSLTGSFLMLVAGVAWGIYSLRGRGAGDPSRETAGNFLRTVPLAIAISLVTVTQYQLDIPGSLYAIASGALASGMGYALWYSVLPRLRAMTAATVQLSVPVISALGGVLFLSEQVTLRLGISSTAILGGIALFIASRRTKS